MTEVLVERRPDAPLTIAEASAIIQGGDDCRGIHGLTWHRSLLSNDGQQMICHLTSPDLESVRIALRSAPVQMDVDIWACTVTDAPGLTLHELAQANVLASFRADSFTPEQLTALDDSGAVCVRNHRVRVLRTFIASDRRRAICLCLAADAESVRLALRELLLPVERVSAFRQFHL